MKAVIMAGGIGSRLRPLTCDLPKPMVPIVGKPVMQHGIGAFKKARHNKYRRDAYVYAGSYKKLF